MACFWPFGRLERHVGEQSVVMLNGNMLRAKPKAHEQRAEKQEEPRSGSAPARREGGEGARAIRHLSGAYLPAQPVSVTGHFHDDGSRETAC